MVGQNEDVSKPCTTVVAVVHSYRPIPHPMLLVQHIPSSKLVPKLVPKLMMGYLMRYIKLDKIDDGIFDYINVVDGILSNII